MTLLDKDKAATEAHSGSPTLCREGEAWKKYRGHHCSEIENYSVSNQVGSGGVTRIPKA